jgi:hypothetical protein
LDSNIEKISGVHGAKYNPVPLNGDYQSRVSSTHSIPRTKVPLDKVKEIYVGDQGAAPMRIHHQKFMGSNVSPRNFHSS